MIKRNFLLVCFVAFSCALFAQTPAFLTAEGYGKWATGGRGGQVVEVTTLEDDPSSPITGSLRWAMKQYSGQPITIVFRVSGIIDLNGHDLRITRSNMTIAGQTAPGDGICIKGGAVNLGGSRNLIIRHIRSRVGVLNDTEYNPTVAPTSEDFIAGASLNIENGGNFIVDHCSFAWSAEENVGFYDNDNTTVQWCIFSEGLYDAGHGKGARSYGAVLGGKTATYHHNLLAHNYNRSPRFGATTKNDVVMLLDYVNNVNYNSGKKNACYGGDNRQGDAGLFQLNYVNNYCKPGPAYTGDRAVVFIGASYCNPSQGSQGKSYGKWHLSGNYMEGSYAVSCGMNEDNYKGFDIEAYQEAVPTLTMADMKSDHIAVLYPVQTQTAQEAYESVLKNVGAFPRDSMDRRVLNEVATGTASASGTFNNHRVCGIINKPSDSGGYPEYKTYNEVTDADHDGMDDAWETANGLDPKNAEDRNFVLASGYTALEAYLGYLVGENISVEKPRPYDIVVAQDGSGDYATIKEAVEAAPEGSARTTIFVKKGVYEEKVFIGNRWQSSKKIISLIGEEVDSVVVVWDDYHGKTISYPGKEDDIVADGMTAPSFTVTSPDFYMENMTIKNPSQAAQAEALYQAGDRQVLKNCKLLGYQDTHRTKKGNRFFYYQCVIEGGVDFIYAGGTCYFYQCDLVSNAEGYITAPEDITYKTTLSNGKTLYYGFVFNDCNVLAKPGVTKAYLGRPWQEESGSIFMNSRLGNHINAAGWSGDLSKCSFAEFKNLNADGTALADVSKRNAGSIQLTANDRYDKLGMNTIYQAVSKTNFDPVSSVIGVAAPKTVTVSGKNLSWTAVEDAVGYIVYANDVLLDFTEANAYYDTHSYQGTVTYKVRSIAENGGLSGFNGTTSVSTVELLDSILNPEPRVKLTTSVQPEGAGTVMKSPALAQYLIGTAVTLTAYRQFGYRFAKWIDDDGAVLSTDSVCSYTIKDEKNITAIFEEIPVYALNCNLSGVTGNLIKTVPSPHWTDGLSYYEAETQIQLYAADSSIYVFSAWENGSVERTRTLCIRSDTSVTAVYETIPFLMGWNFRDAGNEYYAANVYSDEDNVGELNIYDNDRNCLTWKDKSIYYGSYLGRGAALNGHSVDLGCYFEIEFSTLDCRDLLVKSGMAIDENGYAAHQLEYSIDGRKTYLPFGVLSIPAVKVWADSAFYLPEDAWNQNMIYIRWVPTENAAFYGSKEGIDGTAISEIYILIRKKDALTSLTMDAFPVWIDEQGQLLHIDAHHICRIFLYDMIGRCVDFTSGRDLDRIDLSARSKGVYLLRYEDENGSVNQCKVMKK